MSKVDGRKYVPYHLREEDHAWYALTVGWLLCQLRLHRSQPAQLNNSYTPQFKEIPP